MKWICFFPPRLSKRVSTPKWVLTRPDARRCAGPACEAKIYRSWTDHGITDLTNGKGVILKGGTAFFPHPPGADIEGEYETKRTTILVNNIATNLVSGHVHYVIPPGEHQCLPSIIDIEYPVGEREIPWINPPELVVICQPAEFIHSDIYHSAPSPEAVEPQLVGCPTEGFDTGRLEEFWEFVREYKERWTLDEPITKEEMIDAAIDALPEIWEGADNKCAARMSVEWPKNEDLNADEFCMHSVIGGLTAQVQVRKTRFKNVVSEEHVGDMFKWWWDIYFFPADGSAPVMVEEDVYEEWFGPGSGPQDDPSWEMPWHIIEPPTEPGEKRRVNLRFECYVSPYGQLPQIDGEGT